jgi:hypothetical protein
MLLLPLVQGCLQLLQLLLLRLHGALVLQHLLMCLKHLAAHHVLLGLQQRQENASVTSDQAEYALKVDHNLASALLHTPL